jgi:protease-4
VARVGFVHAVGPIVRGRSDDPFGDLEITGDTYAQAIDAAREDEVDVVLLRVSSPGGSAVASETVAAAVRRARDAGIPVIVSMGDVAASGGYWISMDADRILAAPTTLTGSIGVITGKPAIGDFLADLGIDVAIERRGANAGFGSVFDPWDERALERANVLVDDLYTSFLDGVAQGRGLEVAAVRDIAGGRVWLGGEAVANGLVDATGGFLDAVAAAREAAGVAAGAPVTLEPYPRPVPPFRAFVDEFGRFLATGAAIREFWQTLVAEPALRFEAGALPRLD